MWTDTTNLQSGSLPAFVETWAAQSGRAKSSNRRDLGERRRPDSNRGITDLQSAALPLGYGAREALILAASSLPGKAEMARAQGCRADRVLKPERPGSGGLWPSGVMRRPGKEAPRTEWPG